MFEGNQREKEKFDSSAQPDPCAEIGVGIGTAVDGAGTEGKGFESESEFLKSTLLAVFVLKPRFFRTVSKSAF